MDKLTSKLPTLKRQQKKRVGFALGCALLCLFSMGALGSPDWTSYENKSMGFEGVSNKVGVVFITIICIWVFKVLC